MRQIITFIACVILSGCVSGHQQFYKSYGDKSTLPPDIKLLGKGETPQAFSSNDLQRDVKVAWSKGFIPIGESSFNGKLESEQAVIDQAKKAGAVLVLVNSNFAGTQTITTPFFIPNNQTTYNSGVVNGAYGSVNYSGTSTTYGTAVVPITSQQQRYDQTAVYFAKITKKPKFGIHGVDLPPELRTKYERNTGVLIDNIFEESPAFAANILPGDILTEFNGTKVINTKHVMEIMQSASPKDGKCFLKILRNGTEKDIELQLAQTDSNGP